MRGGAAVPGCGASSTCMGHKFDQGWNGFLSGKIENHFLETHGAARAAYPR